MAYPNSYFPTNYSPYPQIMPYQMPQNTAIQTYQNGGNSQNSNFVHVQNEAQAREWSVALGSSVTFINDNEPYCYTKSMGMSQLEPPIFKRFRLVEEQDTPQNAQNAPQQPIQNQSIDLSEYISKAEFEPFNTLLNNIRKELDIMRKDLYENEQPVE